MAQAGQNRGLLTRQQMVDKIRAASDARTDMVVTVRLQGFNTEMLERTLERGQAYAEAGADVLWFVPMPRENMVKAADAVKKPLMMQLFFDEPMSIARQNRITMGVYASLVQNIAQSAVYDALMEFKQTGTWTKSAKGQRLGNTIPAEFRQRMLRQADHTDRAKKYGMSS
jgi:2-methylisocitrate lyase-like PEP mutase family enzyme